MNASPRTHRQATTGVLWVGAGLCALALGSAGGLGRPGASGAAETRQTPASAPVTKPAPLPEARSLLLRQGVRVVTYEFLEGMKGGAELSAQEVVDFIDKLGGADVLLCKGLQFYRGKYDDSSGGYPRFQAKIDRILPLAHGKGVLVGIFGFTQRGKAYKGQGDYAKVLSAWKHYVDQGADLLFVDEESGKGGLDIPQECLAYCDDLRARFKRPVGLFLYGAAGEGVPAVRKIAPHVDVLGEMAYSLYLDKMGEYNLAKLTREWSAAARKANPRVAYWTGAGIFGAKQFPGLPGTPMWQDRYGQRDESQYFHDYLKTAAQNGASGVFYHSICRTTWWPEDRQKRIISGVGKVFAELVESRRRDRPDPAR